MSARIVALWMSLFALIACSRERTTAPPPPIATTPSGVRDLASVMDRAPYVFRARGGDALSVRRATYVAEALGGGLSVTPRGGVAARFAEAAITIGERSVDHSRGRHVDAEGAIVSDRGEVVERVRADERGVELTWTLAHRVSGALTLRLPVEGATNSVVTDSGAHLTVGGAGLRVTHAVLIDATGARTTARFSVDGDSLVGSFPAEVLARAAYPITIDPVISPEIAIDAPITTRAAGSQREPQVACGSTNCLVVWRDRRGGGANSDLFAARISSTGSVLDPFGIPLAVSADDEGAPRVAWNGSKFFVAWSDGVNTSVMRVASTGAILDSAPKTIPGVRPTTRPSMACSPTVCLVATEALSLSLQISRFDDAGTLLETKSTSLVAFGSELAFAAGTFLLAFDVDGRSVGTTRVDALGNVLDATRIPLPSTETQRAFRLGASPTGFMLVLDGDRYDTLNGDLIGTRIGLDGIALDPSGIDVRRNNLITEHSVGIAFDGTNWVLTWTEINSFSVTEDVVAARINTTGRVLDSTPMAVTSGNVGDYSAIAFNGTSSLIVYASTAGTPGTVADLYFRSMDTAGRLGAETLVTRSANAQHGPVAAWNGANWLVVWHDARANTDASTDIYAVRLDAAGTALDAPAFAVATTAARSEHDPAIASDGKGWFVVWTDNRRATPPSSVFDVYGARIDSTGAVLDPAGIAINTAGGRPGGSALAFDGTNYLVTWPTSTGLSAVRVTTTGSVLSPPTTVMTGWLQSPSVAFDGTNFLVVAAQSSGMYDIYGALVSKAGVPVGTSFAVSAALNNQERPRVAFGGGVYLAVWVDRRDGKVFEVYGARIRPDGTVLDPSGLPIAGVPIRAQEPDVAFDGNDFFVVWEHYGTPNSDLRAAIVSTAGALRAPSPFALTTTTDSETAPRIAVASKTRRLLTYTRFDLADSARAPRARARFIDGLSSGACASGAECISGLCADGVCCNSACTGQCEACNVAERSGFCVPVTGAPRGARAACGGLGAGTACGARCDGTDTTKCNYAPVDTVVCSTTACVGGIETHASTCDGAGACRDVPASCGAYSCGGTTCRTTCTTSTDCASGFACKDGACVPSLTLGNACTTTAQCAAGLFCTDGVCCAVAACGGGESCAEGKGRCIKLNGTTCSLNLECASNRCVDGVCCDSACDRQCEACDVEGTKGKCLPINGAPHGTRAACEKGSDVCAARTCDGAKDVTTCVGYASGPTIECSAARCDGDRFSAAAMCTGAGACATPTETSCVPYACAPTGCRTSCVTPEHCAAGFQCRDGVCEAMRTTCSSDGASVVGADGAQNACAPYVCRAGACVGRCESTADCSNGTTCDASGRCVPRPPSGEIEDGGGCALAAPAGSPPWAWLLLSAAALLRSRVRRSS